MRKNLKKLWVEMGIRARVALPLSLLWILALAIIGFIHTVEIWIKIFGIGLIVALLVIGVKFYLQRQRLAKAEVHKNGAADFLFSFMQKYPEPPIKLMPVMDGNEVRRIAELSVNKGIVIVSFRLLLSEPLTNKNTARPIVFTFGEWLMHYSEQYCIEKNFAGCDGFPLYYPTCTVSGQNLVVLIVIIDNKISADFVKNPSQPIKTPIDYVDKDFGGKKENSKDGIITAQFHDAIPDEELI